MSSQVVGILGGGQLGRMLMEAANHLNLTVNILDVENSPAKQISAKSGHVTGSFTDHASILKLAETSDVLTAEIEHVDSYTLEEVSKKVKVEPSWQTFRTIQDKFRQKEHLAKYGIPMAEHRELFKNEPEELAMVGKELGFPLMLKSKTEAFDGRGNYAVHSEKDIPAALEALKGRPLYAEKWAKFRMELAAVVVKTKDTVLAFPTVETVQENSICKLVYAPPRNVSSAVITKAQELARNAVAAFEGRGVFGVEMFLLEDDSLLLCEVACRVHNSGHFTIEGCAISQFDAHLRAILDLPIPKESLELRQPSIMLNILGGAKPESHLQVVAKALEIPNAAIHMYSKGAARPGRKMGHVTVTAKTLNQAERYVQPLIALTDELRSQRTDIPAAARKIQPTSSLSQARPTVAVIMGSDSDLKVAVPGLKLLEEYFHITPYVDIVSAHRTPEYMAEFATTAESKGFKVLICLAGGAAHLAGMTAAHTSLPVIGIPVKASVLDGVDSLYSIVQMPRGGFLISFPPNESLPGHQTLKHTLTNPYQASPSPPSESTIASMPPC